MIYVAIIGALTPFGQFIAESLKNSETVKVLFTVDEGYYETKPTAGQYRTIDEAFAEQHGASFYVIDVINDDKTAERAMSYRFYGVSAIVCGLTLNPEDVKALEKGYSVRRRTFAPVVVEPQLSQLADRFNADEKEPMVLDDMYKAIRKLLRWLNFGKHPIAVAKQVYYNVLQRLSTEHTIVPVLV
ncbi:MAG: hypothetical protein J6N49_02645 [Alphaproteobacteria bacterium]|nr:hypothetical protein [Alphaproteobacteria bacterium]